LTTVQKSLQREALKLVFWQLMITMVLSIIILLVEGLNKGLSTFLGGGAYILPNFIFAWRVFSHSGPGMTERFMIKFLLGEFSKLIVSAILFILIVKYLSMNVVFVMAGYTIAIVSFWFASGWHFGRSKSTISSTRASS
jgi:ATP synthase protein I